MTKRIGDWIWWLPDWWHDEQGYGGDGL